MTESSRRSSSSLEHKEPGTPVMTSEGDGQMPLKRRGKRMKIDEEEREEEEEEFVQLRSRRHMR